MKGGGLGSLLALLGQGGQVSGYAVSLTQQKAQQQTDFEAQLGMGHAQHKALHDHHMALLQAQLQQLWWVPEAPKRLCRFREITL